jgi:hypothetical protein
MKNTPWSNRSISLAATRSARRVLPVPPGPVRVSRRTVSLSMRARISRNSVSRPMNVEVWVGRLLGRRSGVANGGKS